MTPEDTIAAVTLARLDLLKVVDLPPYHYAAIFERPESIGAFEHEETNSAKATRTMPYGESIQRGLMRCE